MTSLRFARAVARRSTSTATPPRSASSTASTATLPRAAPGVVGAFAAGAAAATYGLYQIREFARVEGALPSDSSALLRALLPVKPQAPTFVRVVVADGAGARRVVRVDERQLAAAAATAAEALDAELPALRARSRARLDARVREAVAGCGGAGGGVDAFADWYYAYRTAFELMRVAVWNSNLQPDFNVRVCDRFDASSFAVLRELDESHRSVQKSAESTSM